jgi:hypothetical protein
VLELYVIPPFVLPLPFSACHVSRILAAATLFKSCKTTATQIPILCPPWYLQYSFRSKSFSHPRPRRSAARRCFTRTQRISILLPPTSASCRPWPGWSLGELNTAGVASMTRFRRRSLESHAQNPARQRWRRTDQGYGGRSVIFAPLCDHRPSATLLSSRLPLQLLG